FPDNHKSGDSTGKFAIHRDKRVYNCFVCGGGSLLSLAMELRGLDVEQATDFLHQFTLRSSRSDADFQDHLLDMLDDVEHRVKSMPYFNPHVLERFDGSTNYFRERGV